MILDTNGAPLQPRAELPIGDMRMPDGRLLRFRGAVQAGASWTTVNGLRVLASIDPTQHGRLLHVSLSYTSRDPNWTEIRAVRDLFYPSTIDVMMVLPQRRDYVNLHPHTFHLWQTPMEWGVQ